jgi:hypothetical protein
MCPLHLAGAAGPLPGDAQTRPDFRDTLSALRLAVKALKQDRHGTDAGHGQFVHLPLGQAIAIAEIHGGNCDWFALAFRRAGAQSQCN